MKGETVKTWVGCFVFCIICLQTAVWAASSPEGDRPMDDECGRFLVPASEVKFPEITVQGPKGNQLLNFAIQVVRSEWSKGFLYFPQRFEILVVPEDGSGNAARYGVHKLRTFPGLVILPQKYVDHFLSDRGNEDPSGAFRGMLLRELGYLALHEATHRYAKQHRALSEGVSELMKLGWKIVHHQSLNPGRDADDDPELRAMISDFERQAKRVPIDTSRSIGGIPGDFRPLLANLFVAAVDDDPRAMVRVHQKAYGIDLPQYGFQAYVPPAPYTEDWRNDAVNFYYAEARPRVWRHFENQTPRERSRRLHALFLGLNAEIARQFSDRVFLDTDRAYRVDEIREGNDRFVELVERIILGLEPDLETE